MTKETTERGAGRPAKPPASGASAREERLRAALRANLQRRKAQARDRAAGADSDNATEE
ncbi:hypothetical protein [Paracoccus jiaweipingae]|uniref:hypothetical protein n=1 Tax=unclassified Paracoccus (in: a-proteobacteria) TaxID=2688777 RepID=UPI003793F84B